VQNVSLAPAGHTSGRRSDAPDGIKRSFRVLRLLSEDMILARPNTQEPCSATPAGFACIRPGG
jgi:hypothetical protein